MAGVFGGDPAKQLEALLAGAPGAVGDGAAVRLIHDDQFRAFMDEVLRTPRGLDEIGGNHREGIAIEDGDIQGKVPFQALDGSGKDQLRFDVKFLGEFHLPLLG